MAYFLYFPLANAVHTGGKYGSEADVFIPVMHMVRDLWCDINWHLKIKREFFVVAELRASKSGKFEYPASACPGLKYSKPLPL